MIDYDNQELLLEQPDPLTDALKRLFGLSYLFPYQRLVITNILQAAGCDITHSIFPPGTPIENKFNTVQKEEQSDYGTLGKQIVILPTGAGKSLCFQFPAMLIDGITLVIYPILSLMADQERRLKERGFNPVIIRGGQTKEERNEIWHNLNPAANSNGQAVKIIIANPEVLLTPQVEEQLKNISIKHVVIDEAHCVSEWGESFRPSYLEIGKIIERLNPPLVTAFTATASSPVLEKIKNYIFGDSEAHLIMGNPDRPNITYTAKGCINRDLTVRDLLISNERPAIVFCSSRPGTEKLARFLRNDLAQMHHTWHSEIRFYHAGLSREEKKNIENWFIDNKDAVLCATCAYGMGVDKADVRTVIHSDCAPSVEAYLQESGRAGRDGQQSKAILLWGPDDETAMTRAKTGADRARLAALLQYAKNTEKCRRHSLLALLNYDSGGEVPEEKCCDVCEGYASDELREEPTILDFFRKNKRRFTQEQAAAVLAESNTIRWSEDDASHVISHLTRTGRLKRINRFPWKKKLTMAKKI